jgi:hypothetical protein
MLPKNTLRDKRLERLKVFETDEVVGGLGGNVLSSWGGSLIERRGLLVDGGGGGVEGTSGGGPGATGAQGATGGLGTNEVDWTKPLPDDLRTARARPGPGKKRVVHQTKVKVKREGLVPKAKVS